MCPAAWTRLVPKKAYEFAAQSILLSASAAKHGDNPKLSPANCVVTLDPAEVRALIKQALEHRFATDLPAEEWRS